jgi:PAS domain S-box-containing protein
VTDVDILLAREIIDNSTSLIYVLDAEGRFVLVNRKAESVLGVSRENLIGKTRDSILPKEAAAAHRSNDLAVMRAGHPITFEEENQEPDGKHTYLTMKSPLTGSDGSAYAVCGISTDITDRKLLEESLRASELRFRLASESLTDVIYEWDLKDRVDWFGDIDGLLGYPAGAFPRTLSAWAALLHADDVQRVFDAIDRQLKNSEPYDLEYRIRRRDDTWRWWSVRGTATRYQDGRPYSWIGSVADVTDRKTGEDRVRKLNRVHAVLGNINHAIVHIHTLRLMLQEGCRIAVDDGHFAMALVGIVDPRTRKVEPVALKRPHDGSQPASGVDLNEFQQCSGLTGTAIVTGMHTLSNDIEHDAIMLPWRGHVLRMGFRSSASFPLKVAGETRGAFTLYAAEAGFFTEDEVRLLAQLAQDISFAIEFNEEESKRKWAQEALSKSEQNLHQMFEEAPVGYHEIDAQGQIVRVNRTELEMLGYQSEEMLHHPVWEFIVERELSRKAIAAKLAGNLWPDSAYERSFRKKDGTALHALIKDRALRNESGKVVGLRATVQDITERKKAERELRLLGQTIASLGDCISITDLENRFLFVNDAFRATYGYAPDELLGKGVSVLRSPLTPPATTDRILPDTLAGGWHGELLNRRKDGSDIPVELWTSVVRDEAGNPVGLVGVARDITIRRTEEEHLRQSEERFRLIAENIADMIAVLDLDGRRLYNSPSYGRILADPESLKGTDGFHDVHPEDRERVKQVFQDTIATGIGQRIEYRFLSRDGTILWIDSKGSVIRNKDGKVSMVVVISRDVTEEKVRAEHYLRAQRLESIGTLAGGIAHDLNNVLSPIMMAVQVLRNQVSSPRGQHLLDTIQTSARRGSDIVKQVLTFGRGFRSDRILIQLTHVIREVAKIIRETFPKSIEFKEDIPHDLWTVSADPTQMHQVLLNVLLNARDAMPAGGTLTLSAGNVTLEENTTRQHPGTAPGAYVSIAIADSGSGIPEDIRQKIFEPFFTTKEFGIGTGLGLSTTLSIVKSHGGFIDLETEMGKGTTLRVFIPSTGTASGIDETTEEANLPPGHGELILVIDDEAAIREITVETLQAFGYNVITASNGAEGVAVYASRMKEIKAVITDIMMPVMDGTAGILALQAADPDVRIITTSGLTTGEQIPASLHGGVQAHLTKPYTAQRLLRVLAEVLG